MSNPPVAIYARISQDRQKNENGVSVQKADCLDFAAANNLKVVKVISDNDVSAAGRKQRAGFETLKKMAISKAITGVVVWHPDRLYRVSEDLEALIKICEVYAKGFRVYSVRAAGVDLDTASGRQQARILNAVSQHEIEHKAERQSRAQLRVFEAGDWGGGKAPTGYKRGPTPGTLVLDEPIADLLREIAARLLTGETEDPKFGLTAATRLFRERTGRRNYKPISLRGTLLGPSIVALRSYLPESVKRAAVEAGTPIPEGTEGPANWPQIIDHFTQEELKKIIPLRQKKGRPARSLLAGILICGRCGTTLGYSKAQYKCNMTGGGCGRLSVTSTSIEEWAIGQISTMVLHGQFSSRLTKPTPMPTVLKTDELKALDARAAVMSRLFAKGSILTEELYEKALEEIAVAREELKAKAARAVVVEETEMQKVITVASRWEDANLDTSARNAVIAAVYPEIIIRPTSQGKRGAPRYDESGELSKRGPGFDASRVSPKRKKGTAERLKAKYAASFEAAPTPE